MHTIEPGYRDERATTFTWRVESTSGEERPWYRVESYQSASFVFPFQKIVAYHTYSCTFATSAICEHMEIPRTSDTKGSNAIRYRLRLAIFRAKR